MKTIFFLVLLCSTASPIAAQGGEWRTDFSNTVIPLDELVSGGPPKDGIPAIDNPRFVTVDEADDWIGDSEPLALVVIDGVAKAYPLQILIWHEIVNDSVGDTPVSVTFCPLCNTTLAFDRRFDGRVLDFGTTGRLRNSDLVMYDRQTETWWQQATGRGLVGEYAGNLLTFIPALVVSWEHVRTHYASALVLSRNTGYRRSYGENPYRGYDDLNSGRPLQAFFRGLLDDRLRPMERVVAVKLGIEVVAYPFSSLERDRVVNDEVGDVELVVFWAPGTSSALDARRIDRGRDIGAGTVYSRRFDGRTLRFEAAGDGRFRDRETGSLWTVTGRATTGPLAGAQLTPVQHGNHFWFAWSVFQPLTDVRR